MKDMITSFVAEAKKDITDNNFGDNYCIIVTAGKGQFNSGSPRFVYRGIDDFEAKAETDMNKIDSSFSINVQLWIFD